VSTTEPEVSVVVPSVSGTPAILECLAALADQDGAVRAEVVVVDRTGEATRDAIRRQFPHVRLVAMDTGSPLPEMRGRGVAEARGRMIAVLGEHLRPARSWLRAIGEAHRDGRDVIGGPIDSGRLRSAAEWAFFLSEYGRFMPPLGPDPHHGLPGSNCAYRRAALDRVGARSGTALWDGDLAARLGEAGMRIAGEPGLSARNERRLDAGRLLAQRHHCSRTGAAHRSAGWPRWKRLGFALGTPLLPPLVLVRIARTAMSKRRHRRELLRALPLLAAVSIVWAVGEAVGVLFGPGPSPGLLE
jgi:glycosyl transferase family 2